MQSSQSKTLGQGWDKNQVAFRLGKQRLVDLMAIASSLPDGATPTDAISRAIELARISQVYDCADAVEAAQSVDLTLATGLGEIKEAQERQGEAIWRLESALGQIQSLLIAAAAAGRNDGEEEEGDAAPAAPIPFASWLSAAIKDAGLLAMRSAIATGCLHSISLVSDRLARLDFQVELAAVDGKKLAGLATATARLDLVDLDSPLLRTPWGEPLYFVAQPLSGGWNLHVQRNGDGKAIQSIGTLAI